MNSTKKALGILAACVSLAPGAALAHNHNTCVAEAVMQTGDFDGDGTITPNDLQMLNAYKDAGDYAAFFDMNADGLLNGQDTSMVAQNMGTAGSVRDGQMASLFASTEPYRNMSAALADGYIPFTPDLYGHGIHFANFGLINSWASRGFTVDEPEGLNYSNTGELIAAFYYAPGGIDLFDYGQAPEADTYFQLLPVPPSLDGVHPHDWHNHVGTCFAGASCPVPGFDQCMTQQACSDIGGTNWSPKFHMLHVWMYEFNQCGPFAGIDPDISIGAPHEPNHGDCNPEDIVPVVVNSTEPPMGFEPNACYDD
ncbi:MAG: hypothetical protein KDA24_28665 [Deltaproteobacteria bacterium]|nr:hypothetical protein [Deltaproteobacteria bacterium]